MNPKLHAIKQGQDHLLLKQFSNQKMPIVSWKNSRYLWCSHCQNKVKYCNECKDKINDKIMLVNAKQRAFYYIDRINKELMCDIEKQVKDPEIIKKKQEQINKVQKKIEECKKKALIKQQKEIKRQKKILRKNQEEKLNEIDKAWKLLKTIKPQKITIKDNTYQIKYKLKPKITKLLNFYNLKYCPQENRCNINRHIHIIHELVPCQDLLLNSNPEIFGHLVQFAKCISKLFYIPLKFDVICLGKNTKLINRFNQESVNLYLGTTIMFIELTYNLQSVVEKYFSFNLNLDMKLKNIVYSLVIIRQILTKLFY